MPAAVTARSFGWRHAGRKKPALSNIDLDIPAGQRVLLAGASGAGKSTLLHALAGVLPAESGYREGELLIDGLPPDPTRGKVGLVLQDPDSQVILSTVGADVSFGLENLRVAPDEIRPRAQAALDVVGLSAAGIDWGRSTQALSGGQKQRLAIAGVIAMEPDLLVLDEPTANVDPASVPIIRDAVIAGQERTGATMIVVEHRLSVWAGHVDRIMVLGRDGVIADGTPDTVLADERLRDTLQAAGLWLPGSPAGGLDNRSVHAALQNPRQAPAAPGEVLLSTHGLAVGRGGHANARGIELSFEEGTATGFTGPNGAGKSTTALTLSGLLRPVAGEVRAGQTLMRPPLQSTEAPQSTEVPHAANGTGSRGTQGSRGAQGQRRMPGSRGTRTPRSLRPHDWSPQQLVSRIGTVFQEPEHQFVAATVRDELTFGPLRAGASAADAEHQAEAVLHDLRLEHLAAAHPQTLSGGEKRRLSVACMLTAAPPVLIVDEPTFGQDANTWATLAQMLRAHVDHGGALIAVSHDEEFLAAVGARECAFATSDNSARSAATSSRPAPLAHRKERS